MLRLLPFAVLLVAISADAPAQQPILPPAAKKPAAEPAPRAPLQLPKTTGKHPWTAASALEAYQRQSDDPYLLYVAATLARHGEAADKAEFQTRIGRELARQRARRSVDALSLFSGAHAVQETLQLDGIFTDELLPDIARPRREADDDDDAALPPALPFAPAPAPAAVPAAPVAPKEADKDAPKVGLDAVPIPDEPEKKAVKPKASVPLASLKGPEVKSHPWTKMLAGKTPAVSNLAKLTPDDFFLVEFRSLNKMLDVLDEGQDWGAYAFTQGALDATDSKVAAKYRHQLLLDVSPVLRPFYDQVVGRVALVGSDLFVREGTDLTVLFELKTPEMFRDHSDKAFAQAMKEGAKPGDGKHRGIAYRSFVNADGSVRAYAADPRPDVHVRSNSLPALKRVLDAIAGAAGVHTLGEGDEFRYIRTLMREGAAEEDGFVYLSDPFIRRLVGPEVKLVERRRMVGFHHLRMISYAAQLYLTQFGVRPQSLKDLEKAGCVPGEFNKGDLASPVGGTYSLNADGLTGSCTVLGRTDFLTPVCELSVKEVTRDEAKLYGRFLNEYNRYWSNFFDPIAVRVQMSATTLRAETIVLPLIDNSIYTGLATYLGGATEKLDGLPVPSKNLLSMTLKLNKPKILEEFEKLKKGRGEEERAALQKHERYFATAASCVGQANPLGIAAWGQGRLVLPCYVERFVDENVTTKKVNADGSVTEETVVRKRTVHEVVYRDAEERLFPEPGNEEMKLAAAQKKRDDAETEVLKKATKVLTHGLGNQVGFHLYDHRIMFDVNTERFLGEILALGGGAGTGGADMFATALPAGFVASSFFSPGYLSATVADAKVVDDFLEDLDGLIAKHKHDLRTVTSGVSFGLDYHHVTTKGGHLTRAFGAKLGPIRWRAYLSRIGDGLFLTNQTEVIDDLHVALKTRDVDRGPDGHGMLRLRPKNWNAALPGFQLAWAESNREACCGNMQTLGQVARAHAPLLKGNDEEKAKQIIDLTRKIHGQHCTCPDGGVYSLAPDGQTIRCSIHGSIDRTHQKEAPEANSPVARLMSQFRDMNASFTFLPEGLRAVVVIERKR